MRVRDLAISCVFALLALTACGEERSGNAFCSAIELNLPQLTSTMLTQEEVRAAVDAYKNVGQTAPIAVREDWDAITELLERTSKLDTTDEAAVQELANLAYETKKPAERARKWIKDKCGLDVATGMDVLPTPAGE